MKVIAVSLQLIMGHEERAQPRTVSRNEFLHFVKSYTRLVKTPNEQITEESNIFSGNDGIEQHRVCGSYEWNGGRRMPSNINQWEKEIWTKI